MAVSGRSVRAGSLALFSLALFCAAEARAQQFNVTVAPNNFSVAAGSAAMVTVTTQSTSTTPSTTTSVTYTLSLTPDFAGGTPQIPNNTPQVSTRTAGTPPNNWTPVTIAINVPPTAVPGVYSGFLFASYDLSPGNPTTAQFGAVFINVTAAVTPTQDFTLTAMPPAITLTPGASQQVVVSAAGVNGFNGSITITAPALSGLTIAPPQLTVVAGQPGTFVISASTNAAAAMTSANFSATATINGTSISHSVPVAITIIAAPNGPTITSVTPPSMVRGAPAMTLRVAGTNFAPGATALIDSPSIVVESTRVLTPQLADVVVAVQPDAELRRTYTLVMRNPNGGITPQGAQLFLYDQDAIGAPLAVRTAAIVSPAEGTLVAGTDAIYPRGLIATTGSGILHGQWRLDGIAYETFDVTAQAGMPVEVRGQVKVPTTSWGDHTLTLAVAANLTDLAPGASGAAVSPGVTIISTIETATKLTIFAPPDRVIAGPQPPAFRWSIVPGANGYLIELGSRTSAAERSMRTANTRWIPTRDELRELRKINGGIVLWRVRAVFPGDVLGEPTAQRAMVILPDSVILRGKASAGGTIAWSGGSDGVLYRIDVLDARGTKLFTAIAVRPEYAIPQFVRADAASVRVTPATPWGESLGSPAAVVLPAITASDDSPASPGTITRTPEDGATVEATQPEIAAAWQNPIAVGDITLFVDGSDVTPVSTVTQTSILYDSLIPLDPGPHTIRLHAGTSDSNWTFTVSPAAAAPAEAEEATPPVPHTDYTLAPNGSITFVHPGANNAHVQLSAQGDIESASHLGTKFTGDLAYQGTSHPHAITQQSRNWVVGGSAEQSAIREQVTAGFMTPDFTNGAEFLTSGLARIAASGSLTGNWGSVSYYQPVTTSIAGVVSGNDQTLRIRSVAFSTPDQRSYQVRAIAIQVDDPGQIAFAGSRMRTFGLLGTESINPQLTLVGEIAHGTLRPDCSSLSPGAIAAGAICPTTTRSGDAFRLGFNGTAANARATYGLMLRYVAANFVNPANRGLTVGGVADRASADLNLGRTFGGTVLALTAREELGGRSHDSTSARSSQSGANLSATTIVNAHLNITALASASQDRSDASASFAQPRTDRNQSGLSATFSELLGQAYAISEIVSVQRAADRVTPLANQTSSSVNITFNGTLRTNLTLSANGGLTRAAGARTVGTTNQYTLSVQPSLAFPSVFLSLSPRVGYNRSTNDLTHSGGSGAQYGAIAQWSPSWWNSLVSGQASANWNGNTASAPLLRMHQFARSYQASIDIRWGLHAGAAVTTPSVLPGAVPQPPPVAQQHLPAVSH